jgi:hypothetical protein
MAFAQHALSTGGHRTLCAFALIIIDVDRIASYPGGGHLKKLFESPNFDLSPGQRWPGRSYFQWFSWRCRVVFPLLFLHLLVYNC